ncbi:MAG: GNAT family N-acetyltransferase [Candidatus Helarchaeota archaeon]|nr:GNAT family N-acetyltransferase [Candidatus Helarchaeota archaeon]
MDNIICREYTRKDYEQVEAVNSATLRVSFSYLYSIYHKKHPDLFLVVEDGLENKIIAFILVDINGGDVKKDSALVYAIGVLENYRRQGIGKLLVNQLIKNLKKHPNIKELYLHVQESNTVAFKFYEKLGFQFSKTIKQFYSWGENAHQLSLEL